MARRGMTGQLNMFDFFSSLAEGAPGEVEMVSLVPSFEEEPEPVVEELPVKEPEPVVEELPVEEPEPVVEELPVEEPEPEVEEKLPVRGSAAAVMSRVYELDGRKIEIAYLNYNKVRIQNGDEEPKVMEFATTKEAVDYYVERMQELEKDE